MLTKGEILSIDFTGNTCTVRMPIFESTAGGDKAIAPAIFSNAPGIKDFYKVGDIVFIAFENGQIQNPVVIGKLFLGTNNEKKTESVIYGTDKIIPATTNKDIDINSVQDVIDNIKKLNIEKQELLSAGNNITITKIYADPETKTKYLRTEISATGGGGGTSNYNNLTNKPKINNKELVGNKTLSELGFVVDSELSIESVNPVENKVITAKLNDLEARLDLIDSVISIIDENKTINTIITTNNDEEQLFEYVDDE